MKYTEINFRKIHERISFYGSSLPENEFPNLETVLGDLWLTRKEWYGALSWARKNDHKAYLEVYAMLGKTPREFSAAKESKEPEEEETSDEDPPTRLQVLTEVMAWLEQASPHDRQGILATAAVFYEVPPQ